MTANEIAAAYIHRAEQCEAASQRQTFAPTVRSLKESAQDFRQAAERVLTRGIGR